MKIRSILAVPQYATCLLLCAHACFHANGATVWNGPIMTFTESSTDWTQPVNQDRITSNVWLTRAGSQGLFNAATETSFTHSFSPDDTEWANGNLADHLTLSYTDWNSWAKVVNINPPSTVGVDAVLHLKTDDIYIGIKFTFWAQRGGTFAYQRTTPSAASPSSIPLNMTQVGNKIVLTWTNAAFNLQAAPTVTGTYTNIAGATSPYTNTISGSELYFRLKL